jgi:hypothetical protein
MLARRGGACLLTQLFGGRGNRLTVGSPPGKLKMRLYLKNKLKSKMIGHMEGGQIQENDGGGDFNCDIL